MKLQQALDNEKFIELLDQGDLINCFKGIDYTDQLTFLNLLIDEGYGDILYLKVDNIQPTITENDFSNHNTGSIILSNTNAFNWFILIFGMIQFTIDKNTKLDDSLKISYFSKKYLKSLQYIEIQGHIDDEDDLSSDQYLTIKLSSITDFIEIRDLYSSQLNPKYLSTGEVTYPRIKYEAAELLNLFADSLLIYLKNYIDTYIKNKRGS